NGFGLATDLIVLGLNAAGAVVGGAEAKSALAAASGGIVGAKGAVDKDLFYQKTLPALIAQMSAQRKVVLVDIRRGLTLDVDQYPLQQALVDLENYYAAGTIPGAINAIVQDAGATSQTAQLELRRDAAFVQNQANAASILARVEGLTDNQALVL